MLFSENLPSMEPREVAQWAGMLALADSIDFVVEYFAKRVRISEMNEHYVSFLFAKALATQNDRRDCQNGQNHLRSCISV